MKDIFYTVIGLALVFWLGIKLWDSGIIWIILIGLIIIATIHSRKQHKAKTHKLNTEEPPAKPEIKENISDEKDEALSVTRQSDDSVLLENNLIKIQNQNFFVNCNNKLNTFNQAA